MGYEQVPDELKRLPRWGLFKKEWVEARQRFTKIPIDPHTGKGGKSNDESTWTTFESALEAGPRFKASGLAFYFKPPYVGIDIDHVEQEMKQYIEGDSENIVSDFMNYTKSYAETSLSGTGVHIIAKGKIPGDKRRHKNVEMYTDGRFFALTGNVFGSHTDIVAEVDLSHLYTTYVEPPKPVVTQSTSAPEPRFNDLDEDEISSAMLQSKSGQRIKRLMLGEWDGLYESQSQADMAFANDLAFWCAKDFSKMDTLFRQSGLMRDKYDEKHGKTTYGVALLNKAIADTAQTYAPKQDTNFFVEVPGLTIPDDGKPQVLPWRSYDDTGLSQRFIDQYGKMVKYDTTNKKFLYFDGVNWNYDERAVTDRLMNRVVDGLKNEPVHAPDGATEKDEDAANEQRGKFIKRSRSNAGKTAATNELKKLIAAAPNDFDNNLGVINTPSGYVDLASGEIRESKPDDMFTKVTMAEYSPTANAPMWMQFLNTVFEGKHDLIDFAQRAVGYSLLGTNEQSVMVIVHGVGGHSNGSNGKSVFVETLRNVLGSYAVTISPDTLMSKRFGMDSAAMADIAKMKGTRFVATSETEAGQRLAESLIKRLTGGEEITGKNLYAQPFSFKPTSVIWMSTNNKPIVRGSDEGIWRRLVFLPFTAVIAPDKKDPMLGKKLLTEAAGILNWAVDGALAYQQNHKLEIPSAVAEQNTEYREEMDTLGNFLDEVAEQRSDYRCTFKDIATVFDAWEKVNGTGMTKAGLNRELGTRFERYKSVGIRGFKGFRIKENVHINDISFNF